MSCQPPARHGSGWPWRSAQWTQGSGDLAFIEISALTKAFVKDDSLTWVMRDVDMQIAQGEFVAIVGPSGCGKSTLLNMVAGLMQPSRGGIKYDGKTVKQINTDVGYMTQRDDL